MDTFTASVIYINTAINSDYVFHNQARALHGSRVRLMSVCKVSPTVCLVLKAIIGCRRGVVFVASVVVDTMLEVNLKHQGSW